MRIHLRGTDVVNIGVDSVDRDAVILIEGTLAAVPFAGVISPGLYQFNVTVPATSASGDTLTARYGGQSTPPGTVLTVQ